MYKSVSLCAIHLKSDENTVPKSIFDLLRVSSITKGRIKKCKILILTEKDLYRLTKSDLVLLLDNFKLLYMKIEFDFINNEKLMFNKQIIKFI